MKRYAHCGRSMWMMSWVMLATLLGSAEVALSQAPHHPRAARRVHAHRVQTHRQNVGGAVQGGRQNVADVRRGRVDNVADRRTARAVARATLPPCEPATVAPSGTIVLPPWTAYIPSVTVAPPPSPPPSTPPVTPPAQAPPAVGATLAEDPEEEGLSSDEQADPFEGSPSYDVRRVEDGGITVVLKVGEGETKIRMIGVAPVTLGQYVNLPERPRGRRLPSTEGYIENLLAGESVHVVYDSAVAEEDADKKCVAYLFRAPDGLMVNQEVIRAGFAVADTRYDFDQKEVFVRYQDAAKKAGRGIHGILQRIRSPREKVSG